MTTRFHRINRDEIRDVFQPSKIVLGVVDAPLPSGYNVLPLCFHTWCSYSPVLYAIAVERANYSFELFEKAREFVLAIVGESMVNEVIFCGSHSGRDCDKVRECGIEWTDSFSIGVPGIRSAISNMEVVVHDRVPSGDHVLVIGEVVSISQAEDQEERPLLTIGPNTRGYEVLGRQGIHTIAVVPRPHGR